MSQTRDLSECINQSLTVINSIHQARFPLLLYQVLTALSISLLCTLVLTEQRLINNKGKYADHDIICMYTHCTVRQNGNCTIKQNKIYKLILSKFWQLQLYAVHSARHTTGLWSLMNALIIS